jgi:putative oxidoreductase
MTSANKRYTIRTLVFMAAYAVVLMLAVGGALDAIGGVSGWLLAAAVSAPVAGQIWATLSFIKESDEFVAAVTAKRFIIAAGLTLALAVFWGFAEMFAGAPHLEGWWAYVAFWALMGPMPLFVKGSAR